MCHGRGDDPRFADCDETTGAVLRFPGERLAILTSTFGTADRDLFRVLGTEGELVVEPPEPGGREGLADVRIIRAVCRSAREGRAIRLEPVDGVRYPEADQAAFRPAPEEQELVETRAP